MTRARKAATTAFETPPRLRNFRTGENHDIDSFAFRDEKKNALERNEKVTEMINPDGSVTIRKQIKNFDGSVDVLEEEYSSLDEFIPVSAPGDPFQFSSTVNTNVVPFLEKCNSDSDSSETTVKTTPSRGTQVLPDRNSHTSFARQKSLNFYNKQSRYLSQTSSSDGDVPALNMNSLRSTHLSMPLHLATKQFDNQKNSSPSPKDKDLNLFSGLIGKSDWGAEKGRNQYPERGPPFSDRRSHFTSGGLETDMSALSGDSIGYPLLDPSTAAQEEKHVIDHSNNNSDSDTEWSLLRDEPSKKPQSQLRTTNVNGPHLPGRYSWTSFGIPEQQDRIGFLPPTTEGELSKFQLNDSPLSPSSNPQFHNYEKLTKERAEKKSMSSGLLVMQQAPLLTRPKTRYPETRRQERFSTNQEFRRRNDLRGMDALFDLRSLDTAEIMDKRNAFGYKDEITYTVRKDSPSDKVGIFVGLKALACGIRLVVSQVARNGKFAESPIEKGDIVVSINGKSFLTDPSTEAAIDIVRQAKDALTFVILKRGKEEDFKSMDELSLPSLPYQHVSEMVNPDQSKALTREIWNKDGSQTVVTEFFDTTGRKRKQTTRRRWVTGNGKTQEISNVSLTVDGELSILVRKESAGQAVGLKLKIKSLDNEEKALIVSEVSPSGLFARTPLSEGDTIISINGIDLKAKPEFAMASSIIKQASGDLEVKALKSREWINNKNERISQTRRLVETFIIPAPRFKRLEFDEASYGGSIIGYQSAKSLTFKKTTDDDRLGLAFKCQPTNWGNLLVVTAIVPREQMAPPDLKVGDIVLKINGVDFTDDVDVQKAMSILRDAKTDVAIEYQHLEEIGLGVDSRRTKITESFKPDGTKCIRTETTNQDGSAIVQIEEIGPVNPVDVNIEEETSVRTQSSFNDTTESDNPVLTRMHTPFYVTVTKTDPSQEVGISLSTKEGVMYVSKISSTGLLVGKPILPGDRILSINKIKFTENPTIRNALAIITNSPDEVSFEVLRASTLITSDDKSHTAKKRFYERLICKKQMDLMSAPSGYETKERGNS